MFYLFPSQRLITKRGDNLNFAVMKQVVHPLMMSIWNGNKLLPFNNTGLPFPITKIFFFNRLLICGQRSHEFLQDRTLSFDGTVHAAVQECTAFNFLYKFMIKINNKCMICIVHTHTLIRIQTGIALIFKKSEIRKMM